MAKTYTATQILKLYRSDKSKSTMLRDEKKSVIPPSQRVDRGATSVRVWSEPDLSRIGSVYGFLDKPISPKIISVYAPKGGVLKSTLTFNFARTLALNGINVLAIGLEVSQRTLTNNLEIPVNYEDLEDASRNKDIGLWEVSNGLCTLQEAILKTNLPTLSYIPESSNLNLLEQKIKDSSRREYYLQRLLRPVLDKYDVIIFDNSPSWGSFLVKNSLAMATDIIAPFSCELESFRSVSESIQLVNDFEKEMELNWNSFSVVPTKIDKTKLSKQIETQYRVLFDNMVTTSSIRYLKAAAEESSMLQQTVVETHNSSPLADDYYGVVPEIWKRMNKKG